MITFVAIERCIHILLLILRGTVQQIISKNYIYYLFMRVCEHIIYIEFVKLISHLFEQQKSLNKLKKNYDYTSVLVMNENEKNNILI